MNLTPLKYMLYIENVTSVFRNYYCLNKCTRIFVIIWVFMEAFNVTLSAVANYEPEEKFQIQSPRTYFLLSTSFSIYLLIASLYYSKTFHRLLLNFDAFYYFCDDGVFYQKMMKAQKVITFRVVSFCCLVLVVYTYFGVPTSAGRMGWVVTIISLYSSSKADIRYIFQYFVIHCILFVVSEQLKTITRSIDSELSVIRKNRKNVEHAGNIPSVAVNYDKLNKWVKAYENVNDSSNLCNSMFSIQVL